MPNIKIQRSGPEMLDELLGMLPAADLGVGQAAGVTDLNLPLAA
jgi:hypothetical protein